MNRTRRLCRKTGGPATFPNSFASLWCGRRDSNPHTLRRQDLNLLRLPIPPRPQRSKLRTVRAAIPHGLTRRRPPRQDLTTPANAAPATGQEPPVNAREHVGQILGNQARAEFGCRLPMQPDARAGRLEPFHALSHKAANYAGEDVPRPGGRKTGRAVLRDGGPAARSRHDGVSALINDDGPTKFGRQARFLKRRMRFMIFVYLFEKT